MIRRETEVPMSHVFRTTVAAVLIALGGGACSGPSPTPRFYFTCGDPVCRGVQPHTELPACTTETLGSACPTEGARCDPHDVCNRLVICATRDPRTQPGGCPISHAALKKEIE